ncbi:ATP-dependent zinc protease [Candidatus Woesearchaeota archaeon]|nr:ATP-dependent zinc protease [Candidatus Woesearchaeota archaeon]
MQSNKTYIGLYEKVTLMGNNTQNKEVIAKIDTGATRSSIDVKLAAGLKLGPVLTSRMIKSAQGSTLRPIVEGEIIIAGKRLKVHFTIANRSKMKFPLLIGQDVLKGCEFLIDPSKV